ncbi:hypothetical protein BABINDRAFT_158938 [Babjeviella inositovora NRRL Y-12698]|uniref:Spindle pole body component n=1 Tax=Babjeviella inositovora NRRL Y-12698 TaxID=984486 RepID=A0A1E3QXB5_9ASCO|nr:uncharacterized protein BABINDRAFT_158938 [Babjeviella inositovora NRRL Y-12698]ODQ82318.1 hypothetical protein BABINDRAFT_158938 [Babjeviella inositovora NRRL Y-12698]
MSLDHTQLHLQRLVRAVVPEVLGASCSNSLFNDLWSLLHHGGPYFAAADIDLILNKYKQTFLYHNLEREWATFLSTITQLLANNTLLQAREFLLFFNTIRAEDAYSEGSHRSFQSAGSDKDSLKEIIQPYYGNTYEDEALHYLSYTLLGSTSKHFPFDVASIELPANISNSISGLLHKLFEPAILYKKMSDAVSSKGRLRSLLKNAYASALSKELQGYVKLVNNLTRQSVSLVQIYLSLYDEILRLRVLYGLTEKLDVILGGDLLTEVYRLTEYGDPLIKALGDGLFAQVCKPYYQILENWVRDGDLSDPHAEFFIRADPREQGLYQLSYSAADMPAFLPAELGLKIYQLGKMIVFLKAYCHELNWLSRYSTRARQLMYAETKGFEAMSITKLTTVIALQHAEVLNHFTNVVHHKYHLNTHLAALKSFLFMGKGDFIQTLLARGAAIFNEPSNAISAHQLTSVLLEAVHATTVRALPQEVLQNLDARILGLTHGNIGWDVFTLEYKVHGPLEFVLNHRNVSSEYLRMFNFLWKLRRTQHILGVNWNEFRHLQKNTLRQVSCDVRAFKVQINRATSGAMSNLDSRYIWVVSNLKRINIARNKLIGFVTVLLDFFNSEVIERNYQVLQRQMRKSPDSTYQYQESDESLALLLPTKGFLQTHRIRATDLPEPEVVALEDSEFTIDELVTLHSNYLVAITRHRLLNNSASSQGRFSSRTFIATIYDLLELVHLFSGSTSEFGDLVVSLMTNIQLRTGQDDGSDSAIEEKLQYTLRRVKELAQRYDEIMAVFVKDLRGDSLPEVKFLGTLLTV